MAEAPTTPPGDVVLIPEETPIVPLERPLGEEIERWVDYYYGSLAVERASRYPAAGDGLLPLACGALCAPALRVLVSRPNRRRLCDSLGPFTVQLCLTIWLGGRV